MFKKLSPALVAISLVAVAQPALAVPPFGPGSSGKANKIIIASKTGDTLTATDGREWIYEENLQISKYYTYEGEGRSEPMSFADLKVGMRCSITLASPYLFDRSTNRGRLGGGRIICLDPSQNWE